MAVNITQNIQITEGVAPYDYIWAYSPSSACETLDTIKLSEWFGTSETGLISTHFTFNDPANIPCSAFNLQVTDSNGCTILEQVLFSNPCNELQVLIVETNTYEFTASVSGGSGAYTYEWSYDTGVWNNGFAVENQLAVSPTPTGVPTSTDIIVKVTDTAYGCETFSTLPYSFCRPYVSNVPVYGIICDNVTLNGYSTATVDLNNHIQACAGQPIDWDTFQILGLTEGGVNFDQTKWTINNAGNGIFYVSPTELIPAGTYIWSYRITDSEGMLSNMGMFHILVPLCTEVGSPPTNVPVDTCNCTIDLCASGTPSATGTLLLDDCISLTCDDGDCIDRSTVTITTGPSAVGATAVYTAVDNIITYTDGGGAENSDSIWVTFVTDGGITVIVQVFITIDCSPVITPPVAVDDEACLATLVATSINVVANDTGAALDPTTVQIVTGPSYGTAVNNFDGTITYTPGVNFQPDSFTYTVSNTGGLGGPSNVATVTINPSTAGTDALLSVCDTGCAAVDMVDLWTGEAAGGIVTYIGYSATPVLIPNPLTPPALGFPFPGSTPVMNNAPGGISWPSIGQTFAYTDLDTLGTSISASGAQAGFYYFTYIVDPTAGVACVIRPGAEAVLEVVANPTADVVDEKFVCRPAAGSITHDLSLAFQGSVPTGDTETWAYVSYTGGGGGGPLDVPFVVAGPDITVSNTTPTGTYQFTFTVTVDPEPGLAHPGGCGPCTTIFTINLVVGASPIAGVGGTITVCN